MRLNAEAYSHTLLRRHSRRVSSETRSLSNVHRCTLANISSTTMLSRTAQRASYVVRTLATRSLASQSSSSSSVPTATPLATTPASASAQSPNLPKTWSTSQRRRDDAYSEARFEQTALDFQPQPLSAMEMIHSEPIRVVHGRKAVCDGGMSVCLSSFLLSLRTNMNTSPTPLTCICVVQA